MAAELPIAEVLDRRFVLTEMRRIHDDLASRLRERRSRGNEPLEHGRELEDALSDAITTQNLAEAELYQKKRTASASVRGRRDTEVLAAEHVIYLPRDPLISVTQSLIEEYIYVHRPELVVRGTGRAGARARGSQRGLSPPVTSVRLAIGPEANSARVRLGERFSMTDPRWIQSKLSEWFSSWNTKRAFRDADQPQITHIADDARIVIVGDWASGIDRAQEVARLMRAAVTQALARGQEIHVVHLGDTYYSGWRREYQNRLLPFWPVKPGEAASSWTLNGNHDMYSGGDGYYELLEEPRFAGHRGLSFFHLRNHYWDVLGLDTAYADHDLAGSQGAWVNRTIADQERKTMLFSHHQPFSGYSDSGRALRDKVLGGANSVDVWFWGHEHRHAHYENTMAVRHGRLLGHGGVPVWMFRSARTSNPPPESWEYRERLPGVHLQPWAMLGFGILDLNGESIDVHYVNEKGTTYRTERLR